MNIKGIRCWFLGCPVIKNVMREEDEQCKHCGRFRVPFAYTGYYNVLDPIHKRIWSFFKYEIWYRLRSIIYPIKCMQCGHRYKHDKSVDHLPF